MRLATILFLLLVIAAPTQAQLSPFTNIEKKVLLEISNQEEYDPLVLLLMNDRNLSKEDYEAANVRIIALEEALKADGIESAKGKKVAKLFEKHVGGLLRSYVRKTPFSSIFKDGTYNAHNGTALYALMAHRFKIPYAVYENDKAPYIQLFPASDKIPISSLPSTAQYLVLDDKEVTAKNFINYLVAHQALPREQAQGDPVALYNKYALVRIQNDLTAVASLLYYNRAMVLLEEAATASQSLHHLRMAYELDQRLNNWYWLSNQYVVQMQKSKQLRIANYEMIAPLANLSKGKQPIKFASQAFWEFLGRMHKEPVEVEKIWNTIESTLTHERSKQLFTAMYYEEKARMQFQKGLFKSAFESAEVAYAADPNFGEVKNIMTSAVLRKQLSNLKATAIATDFHKQVALYPFLLEDENFKSTYAQMTFGAIAEALDAHQLDEALKYTDWLENIEGGFDILLNIPEQKEWIGKIYEGLARLTMDKTKDKSKALALIDKGLALVPGDQGLKDFKQLISR